MLRDLHVWKWEITCNMFGGLRNDRWKIWIDYVNPTKNVAQSREEFVFGLPMGNSFDDKLSVLFHIRLQKFLSIYLASKAIAILFFQFHLEPFWRWNIWTNYWSYCFFWARWGIQFPSNNCTIYLFVYLFTLGFPGEGWDFLKMATWNTRRLTFERFKYCESMGYDILAITDLWKEPNNFQTKSTRYKTSTPRKLIYTERSEERRVGISKSSSCGRT